MEHVKKLNHKQTFSHFICFTNSLIHLSQNTCHKQFQENMRKLANKIYLISRIWTTVQIVLLILKQIGLALESNWKVKMKQQYLSILEISLFHLLKNLMEKYTLLIQGIKISTKTKNNNNVDIRLKKKKNQKVSQKNRETNFYVVYMLTK